MLIIGIVFATLSLLILLKSLLLEVPGSQVQISMKIGSVIVMLNAIFFLLLEIATKQ